MKKNDRFARFLRSLNSFLIFFLFTSFVITCCMTLFLDIMQRTSGIEFTHENIGAAAKVTFINVLLLSLFFSLIDTLRRRLTVEHPAKEIVAAAEKLMKGDFSVRIKLTRANYANENFHEIAECFNRMANELEGIETLKSDFIANVSHELKTPLAVIKNYASILSSPGLDGQKRSEYSKLIAKESERLAALITNILRLSKLENQQVSPMCNLYDLSEQLCEAILMFEDSIEKKNISIEANIEDQVMINADREMLSHVWINLISNAVKFTPAGGRVSISLKVDSNYAKVSVSDTGCGISPEDGKHIFDKFYQGDSSHSTEGNGLGLALVKRIIDISESDIAVESTLGEGTSFTVKIPRRI